MISVIVPVFNEAPAVLLRSLQSLSAQSLRDFECFIVDESTHSETIALCVSFAQQDARFIHVRPEHRLGLAASLNLGLQRSKGELIARFDADDVCEPDRLKKQEQFLQTHREIGVVGSAIAIINDDGEIIRARRYPQKHGQIALRMQWTTALAHPTVMIRRELIERHGGYRADFRYSEDLELWLRLLKNGIRFENLLEPLVRYRQTSFRRVAAHWRHNLKARVSNFAMDRYLLPRLFGIAVIAVFSLVPARLQTELYRIIILSKPRL